ncbi:RDD family protein [Synechococcus sp. CCY 9618]|uniref:RDD family protein n=1 Tax=Synechococcus sp. CCY 9618 TaxID=2815602 RepID=UPI001C24DD23|nr:RDD family protein [Synechococcus sp. CCY 9618]
MAYAGFWVRTAASLVDSVLISLITGPFLLLFYGLFFQLRSATADLVIGTVLSALLVILFWRWKQGTPGKLLFRLRIVDARSGGEPSLRQWCLRYLGYVLSTLPLLLGFLWVAWDPRRQGWHDKIAGTLVIHPAARGTRQGRS